MEKEGEERDSYSWRKRDRDTERKEGGGKGDGKWRISRIETRVIESEVTTRNLSRIFFIFPLASELGSSVFFL